MVLQPQSCRNKTGLAVIISSFSHVRRGQALFEIASWETGPISIKFSSIYSDSNVFDPKEKISEDELLGIYRDALRAFANDAKTGTSESRGNYSCYRRGSSQ